MPVIFFWAGIVLTVWIGWKSLTHAEKIKTGVVVLPFALLVAAAVAKYLGM